MDAHASPHPTDQTLSSYGLGKLADGPAELVNEHLERCPECRERVAEMSADSFLGRVRDAHAGKLASAKSQTGGTWNEKKPGAMPASTTMPPGLAEHPDYEIKRELGRGGMGVVYLAHNTLMGRDEVLKVMGRQIMERPGVLERFVREIRAVARLRHPNIVTAYHASRLGENTVFAMEYVEGYDLAQLVKGQGPLPVSLACNFIYQAALGLQHAHEEGLVHRDIKPGNLMLSRKGKKATVKVLDFGLAKATREENVDGGLTSEGQALGTPDFIAPEQILDATSADIRADIYSLGGTLYYLLSGRPPFQANSLYDMYQAPHLPGRRPAELRPPRGAGRVGFAGVQDDGQGAGPPVPDAGRSRAGAHAVLQVRGRAGTDGNIASRSVGGRGADARWATCAEPAGDERGGVVCSTEISCGAVTTRTEMGKPDRAHGNGAIV